LLFTASLLFPVTTEILSCNFFSYDLREKCFLFSEMFEMVHGKLCLGFRNHFIKQQGGVGDGN